MRILVFQHLAVEHPGVFLDFWRDDGHQWDVVAFDRDAPIPALEGYDLLAVMGGPMDVWQEDAFPWLRREMEAIATWVRDLRRPYLGICLGHQLLGAALGGAVRPMSHPEVGYLTVDLTPEGAADPLFAGLPRPLETLQWHGAEVAVLPEGAVSLAQSPLCPVQAMRWGERAYGLQFHVETTEATVGDWAAIPEYSASLEAALGADGAAALGEKMRATHAASRQVALQLHRNFSGLLARA